MDSFTQIVLGAAVGEVMIGKKIGSWSLLVGGIAGTIPDLDVFFTGGMDDVMNYLHNHRSYSHSMFTHVVLAIPLAAITYYIWKKKITYLEWYWVWFMGLFTHALLDCMTTYGTRLFLPFTQYLVGLNNVSIVDPLYTLPFLILLLIAAFKKKGSLSRKRWGWASIIVSTAYLAFTFFAKYTAHQHIAKELKRQGIQYNTLSTSPTILNSFLWAGNAYTKDSFFATEYSIWQRSDSIQIARFPRNRELVKAHPAQEILSTLEWFSQGKNLAVAGEKDSLHYIVAKWGRGDWTTQDPLKSFLFYYTIYPENGTYKIQAQDPSKKLDVKLALRQIWRRIFYY